MLLHLYTNALYRDVALHVVELAADVANFCDHVEHNEPVDHGCVVDAGYELIDLALVIAASHHDSDLLVRYMFRLDAIALRNVLFDGVTYAAQVADASTWRDIQLVQARHDRTYHADVIGLSKHEQLRHYAFHIAKLAGALARRARVDSDSEILDGRLADMLLFGVKLCTVMNHRLPETPLRSRAGTVLTPRVDAPVLA